MTIGDHERYALHLATSGLDGESAAILLRARMAEQAAPRLPARPGEHPEQTKARALGVAIARSLAERIEQARAELAAATTKKKAAPKPVDEEDDSEDDEDDEEDAGVLPEKRKGGKRKKPIGGEEATDPAVAAMQAEADRWRDAMAGKVTPPSFEMPPQRKAPQSWVLQDARSRFAEMTGLPSSSPESTLRAAIGMRIPAGAIMTCHTDGRVTWTR